MRKDHLLRSLIALFILVSLLVVTALIARAAAVRDVVVSEIAWMGTLTPLVQPGIILYPLTGSLILVKPAKPSP